MYDLEVGEDVPVQRHVSYPRVDHGAEHSERTAAESGLVVGGQHGSLTPDHLVDAYLRHYVKRHTGAGPFTGNNQNWY